jgi:hypothetical protein
MIRRVENLPGFQDSNSFGVGLIHKLVTAGTPYMGSPFATGILNLPGMGAVLGMAGMLAFGKNVTLTDGTVCNGSTLTTGAIFDLQGDTQGIGLGLSPALSNLMSSSGHGVPTHVMAGKMDATNFVFIPAFVPPGSMLSTYNTIFSGYDSDGVVAVTSQLALTSQQLPSSADVTSGLFHTSTLTGIKIALPSPPFPALAKVTFTRGFAEFTAGSQIVSNTIRLLQQPRAFYQIFGPNPFVELTPPIH